MKKFITIAAAFAFVVSAGSASAATSAELQAQIDALLAQLAGLSGGTTVTSATPYNHVVTLRVGSRGTQVSQLQACMNALGYSTGAVDGIFGNNTKSGVMQFQAAKGLAVDGIIGPATGPQFEMACNGTVVVVEDDEDETPSSAFGDTAGEEADIEDTDTSAGDADDIYANTKGQSAAMFEIELDKDGGALRVDRIDAMFEVTSAFGSEDDLYDIIENIAFEVDGDEVADEDTSDKDDWRDLENSNSEGYFRFSGVDYVVEAGETAEFDMLIDVADLDNATELPIDIDVSFEIRYTDESGVTDTVTISGTESFTIEDLDTIEFDTDENNDNPENETVSLNEDADDVLAIVNDIEVKEQDGTIEDVVVNFTFVSPLAGSPVKDIDDLVKDGYLTIDGDDYSADDIEGVYGDGPDTLPDTADDTLDGFTLEFEIDDLEVEDEDEFELSVVLDLDKQNTGSAFLGSQIKVASFTFEGEGQDGDDFSVTENADSAATLTLTGGDLSVDESDVDGYNAKGSNGAGAEVVFELDLDGDSDNDGIVIENLMADILFEVKDPTSTRTGETLADMAGDGYIVTIEDTDGDTITPTNFVIDGSETVVITIEVNATTLGLNGDFEVELTSITWKDWEDKVDDDTVDADGADNVAGNADDELGAANTLTLELESDEIYLEEQV